MVHQNVTRSWSNLFNSNAILLLQSNYFRVQKEAVKHRSTSSLILRSANKLMSPLSSYTLIRQTEQRHRFDNFPCLECARLNICLDGLYCIPIQVRGAITTNSSEIEHRQGRCQELAAARLRVGGLIKLHYYVGL